MVMKQDVSDSDEAVYATAMILLLSRLREVMQAEVPTLTEAAEWLMWVSQDEAAGKADADFIAWMMNPVHGAAFHELRAIKRIIDGFTKEQREAIRSAPERTAQ